MLKQVELGTDGDGDPITSCIVEHCEIPNAPKAKATKLGSIAYKALEELNHLIINGQSRRVVNERIPFDAQCVEAEQWRTACRVKGLSPKGTEDSEKKAWPRAWQELDSGRMGQWATLEIGFGRCSGASRDNRRTTEENIQQSMN